MNITPKSTPTTYSGQLFRSRTEARWARFFDELGTRWEYEPMVAELERGWYLPDFYLPDVNDGWWFEVKGAEPEDERPFELCDELAASTEHPVALAWGRMPTRPLDHQGFEMGSLEQVGRGIAVTWGAGWDMGFEFCRCGVCHKVGLEFEARIGRTCPEHADRHEYNDAVCSVSAAYMVAQGLC